jgi:UDP-N-acetylmuramoyl-tripeptide--D-alanyl-D-alanine ligase
LEWTLADLAAVTGGEIRSGDPGRPVPGLCVDSRVLKPGQFFVALPGAARDGHAFAVETLARGAGGVVVTRDVAGLPPGAACLKVGDGLAALQRAARAHRDKRDTPVIAVTGSNGKTTTKDMTAQVFARAGRPVLATRGNLNSRIGLPLMLLDLEPRHTTAVLEMGASQKGDIASLCALARPRVGVITGIGKAHLEFFGSVEGVLEAKWELVESLPREGLAVINADDPLLAARASRAACSVVAFGTARSADVRAENIRQTPRVTFDLVVGPARRTVRLPVTGLFNARNALAAAAVGLWERIPLDTVVAALESFTPPRDRMQIRTRPNGATFVLDAYNANPDSMRESLGSFAQAFAGRRRVAALGGMLELGEHARAEHRALGEFTAALGLDAVWFLGPEGAWFEEGFPPQKRDSLRLFEEKKDMANHVRADVGPGDAVLFKASRGVKLEEVYES